jgi:hypothetical protein
LGVFSSLSDALSNTLTSGIFHNNCARYFSNETFVLSFDALCRNIF